MADKRQTRTTRRKQKKTAKKPIWKKILLVFLLIFLAIGLGIGGLFTYYIATAPAIDASKLSDPFPSEILDMNEEVVESLGDEQRRKVNYEDLPQVLIDAVVATEDSRFFKHHGIDLRRIGGAIKANILHGFGSEGASTITQQVVERSFLTPDKEIKIKVQEQWLALQLERKYSKEEILEMYLNKIFYGSGAHGVAKASEIYFGKTDLNELTIPEAAILAGLPQRPTAYNPYENPDLMKGRMETVLKLMVRHGKITEEEADEARNTDIESLLAGKRPNSRPYEAFVQQVQKEIEEKVDGADIYSDGLKIYTTLDQDAQKHVEFLLKDSDENPIPYPADITDADGNEHQMQAGMVVLDTKTGAIQAIGGRRNSENNDSYNFAISGGRQPGSTFKPVIAFGPAIEYNKWSTYHQINDDKPYEIGSHKINNWNKQYQGWMSARYALSRSLNVPTMKAYEETGNENAQKFAEGLGLSFKDDQLIPTDAIGGGSLFTPLEIAGAYRAFANEGIYNEPYAVTKVEFPDGKTIDLRPESEAAMSDYTAYMVTDMLKTVMSEGTGTEANIAGLPVAGKTGTTNRPGVDGSPDSWFSGYTTNYTISIWTGYEDNNIALPDTKIPHALFKNAMTELSKDKETKDFVKPDSVVEVGVEKGSNPARLPSAYTPGDNIITELFVKGHEPDKTSEKYDKLDPVSNLSAKYDEDKKSIKVDWDYDDSDDVSFEVSASINGGGMQSLSTTDDKSMEIASVEEDAEYVIQVVAVKDSGKSDPKSVTVNLSDKNDDDDEEEDIPSVSDLKANYNEDKKLIDVSWAYDGPDASFEVAVSPDGQTQTVNSKGIEISGVSAGQTYTVTVTPVDKDNNKGEARTAEVAIPSDDNASEEPESNTDESTENENPDNNGEPDEEQENTQGQEDEPSDSQEDNNEQENDEQNNGEADESE
jgi:penicillin-binding protein 1A